MSQYEFQVDGMNCGHCAGRVENALLPLSDSVEVRLEEKLALVQSSKTSGELLAAL